LNDSVILLLCWKLLSSITVYYWEIQDNTLKIIAIGANIRFWTNNWLGSLLIKLLNIPQKLTLEYPIILMVLSMLIWLFLHLKQHDDLVNWEILSRKITFILLIIDILEI